MCTSLSSFQYDSYSVKRSVCNPIRPSYRLRRTTRRCVVKRSVAESRTCVDIHPISKKKPGRDAIDWTMLEAVIKENPDLYGKLKYKSA